ncbi:MAG: glutamyl-tRNA reductase [SAR92 clade bacterium]|uniref:Glutamyl-tRNA reductase n=1 Tax=SAR92 clade bacterium TaxID=2315479 RepID=A0A520LNG3_9GAMM|nr:MAG: glutamyl-tRNA reductase [SAR92 clade bacterium]
MIVAFGLNHKTASLDLRGKLSFAPEIVEKVLHDARTILHVREIVLLSTCNRTEVYLFGNVSDHQIVTWLAMIKGTEINALSECFYSFRNEHAVKHMIEVASGLDSLVLGEPQIFGQIKSAFSVAKEAGTVSVNLEKTFQFIFSAAKRVRTETAIGKNPVSVASASVNLASKIFSDLGEAHALLIGAGETIELVAKHLVDNGIGKLTVANRTLNRARSFSERFSADVILLSDMPEMLKTVDILISSTASQLPILGKGAVEFALRRRKYKPMFMVDIAVPRDIEPQVEELADVYLYNVDDLADFIEDNVKARNIEANVAKVIIAEEVNSWSNQHKGLMAIKTIKEFRTSAEKIRDLETNRALIALDGGKNAKDVVMELARSITNKLLHTPTKNLKRAGEEGRHDAINATKELFNLNDKENR